MKRQLLLIAVLALVAAPATARANWAGACNYTNHCYDLEKWIMTGSEKIEGASAYFETKKMNVPMWNEGAGAWATNEMWIGFNGSPDYTEVGQIAGGGSWSIEIPSEKYSRDCCSLHAFWSYHTEAGFYNYGAPWVEPANNWNLFQVSGQNHNGTWCDYFESTQAWCKSGFPAWATEAEDGAEYADTVEPENWARSAVNAWWSGQTHNWRKTIVHVASLTCAIGSEYYGDFEWYTSPGGCP